MQKNLLTRLSFLAAAAALTACGGGGGDDPVPGAPQSVALEFMAVAGNTPVQCGSVVPGLGSGAVDAQIRDLRFYISEVALLRADGSAVPLTLAANDDWNLTAGEHRVTLIDLENGTGACSVGTAATNALVRGSVPAGNYVGVKMTMGVPFALNHTLYSDVNTAKPPLDVGAMAWSWQAGRKFMKIELSPENATTAGTYTGGVQIITAAGAQATTTTAGVTTNVANTNAFVYHLGNTGCVADAAATATGGYTCSANNQVPVTIAAFNPTSQRVTMDLQALFAGNNATQNTTGTAAGCMSAADDPQCPAMFTALTGAKSGGTVFRAIAK